MRVLTGIAPAAGGIATHIRHVAHEVEKLGVDVDLFEDGPHRLRGPVAKLRSGQALARAAASGTYDVVAAHGIEGPLLREDGPPRVLTSHGDLRVTWKAHLMSTRVPIREHFVTPYITAAVWPRHQACGCRYRSPRERRGHVSSRASPRPEHGAYRPQWLRTAAHRSGSRTRKVVFLGNWLPRKGSGIIPEIFRLVRRANADALLTLIGPAHLPKLTSTAMTECTCGLSVS